MRCSRDTPIGLRNAGPERATVSCSRPVTERHWLAKRTSMTPNTSSRSISWPASAKASAKQKSARPAPVDREWIQPTSTGVEHRVRYGKRPRARGARRALRCDRAERNAGRRRYRRRLPACSRRVACPRARRSDDAAAPARCGLRPSSASCPALVRSGRRLGCATHRRDRSRGASAVRREARAGRVARRRRSSCRAAAA